MTESTALVVYAPSDQSEKALLWGRLAPDVRRRRAMEAASTHDAGVLCDVLHGYMLVKSRAHSRISAHTLKAYRKGAGDLITIWRQENLLHPSTDAGDRYITLLTATLSPASVELRLAGCRALYRALRWARATQADPFADVHGPPDPAGRFDKRAPYPVADLAVLLANANIEDRVLLLLCAHGGLRISEALALRWTDINTRDGTLSVRHGKGDYPRTVLLSGTLIAALEEWAIPGNRGPLFQRAYGGAFTDATVVRERLRALCAACGIPYRGFHALRHLAASRLMDAIGDLQVVAKHLGHRNIATTAVYVHRSDAAIANVLREW